MCKTHVKWAKFHLELRPEPEDWKNINW